MPKQRRCCYCLEPVEAEGPFMDQYYHARTFMIKYHLDSDWIDTDASVQTMHQYSILDDARGECCPFYKDTVSIWLTDETTYFA
jgi:hypothetical protein